MLRAERLELVQRLSWRWRKGVGGGGGDGWDLSFPQELLARGMRKGGFVIQSKAVGHSNGMQRRVLLFSVWAGPGYLHEAAIALTAAGHGFGGRHAFQYTCHSHCGPRPEGHGYGWRCLSAGCFVATSIGKPA